MAAANGKLILDGKTYILSHVYARQAPSPFDPKKMSTVVMAVDRELSAEDRLDPDVLRNLERRGALNGVEIELHGGSVSWTLMCNRLDMSMSLSKSPDPFNLQVANGKVTGMAKMGGPEKFAGHEYYFEFPVDAALEMKKVLPPPTAADAAAAQNAASVKAYRAYGVALAKGDKAALIKSVDPEKAKMVDTPDFPEMLKFIQSMQPKNIQVLRAVETGDKAELTVSGNAGKETGTVKMQKIGGNWLVMKESWKNAR